MQLPNGISDIDATVKRRRLVKLKTTRTKPVSTCLVKYDS